MNILQPIAIIPDTMNHSYEEMIRSLPPFDEKVLWSFDKDDDEVIQGTLKDCDEDGYKVFDDLDGSSHNLYEFHHYYKYTTLTELLKTVPDNTNCETSASRALDHSFQMSNQIS